MRYAGFWKRLWAYSIDVVILQVTMFIVFYLLPSPAESTQPESSLEQLLLQLSDPVAKQQLATDMLNQLFDPVTLLIMLGIPALYNIGFVACPWQATIGKKRYKMKVVTVYGEPVGLVRATIRHAACALSTLTGLLGFIVAAFHPEKAALHDLIAGTRVIYDDGGSHEVL